ncbi:MAG TPA: NAD(P)-binding protein, partial [Acidiphilium sp.]|nr:NAD(P)-binding protein [Acidiphilium sp.]
MSGGRLAVIGGGIAGMAMAWLARARREVVLFEAASILGGHADTQHVRLGTQEIAVDTGFIVLNDRNYPNLEAFFRELGVATHDTDMSFGVSIGGGELEYGGGSLGQLFAQRRNLVRPRFLRMLRDVMRFNREAPSLLHATGDESLGAWLDRNRYGRDFVEDHILPMGAAIWSASVEGMRAFPARHFARFFHNHGLLTLNDRPQWRTVTGGSRRYVERVAASLGDRVRL